MVLRDRGWSGFAKQAKHTYARAEHLLDKHAHVIYLGTNLLAGLLLLASVIYAAKVSNFNQTFNADAIVFPYLFKGFQAHDIIVAAHHSNILKFPLYALQALLPYNFTTFSIVTMGLTVATVISWAALLIWVFGRRYAAIICVLLTALVLGSPALVNDLTGNTIRNIEYPIGFAFIVFVSRVLRGNVLTKWQRLIGVALFILFSMAIAGDSLLVYCFVVPLMLVTIVMWAQKKYRHRQALLALSLIFGVVILSILIRYLVGALGIVAFYNPPLFHVHTVPANALSFSITTATQQFFSLWGGYILGLQRISVSQSIIYFNFLLSIVAISGFYMAIRSVLRAPYNRLRKYKQLDFIVLALGIGFFLTFFVYIFADQVVRPIPNGTLISRDDARYLSLMPLLGVGAVVYILRSRFSENRKVLIGIPAVVVIILFASLSYMHAIQTARYQPTINARNSVDTAIATAHHEKIPLLLTGYWYEATTRFWSHDSIMTASVGLCNRAWPLANTRASWYEPDSGIHKSALLVDRSGRDKAFWNCSDENLRKRYGEPEKIVYLTGVNASNGYAPGKGSLQLWIYDFDLRVKLNSTQLTRPIKH
jgi:hypothetical protein